MLIFLFYLQQVREEMVDTMVNIINEAPPSTPKDAQALAEGLTALAWERAELRVSAQVLSQIPL